MPEMKAIFLETIHESIVELRRIVWGLFLQYLSAPQAKLRPKDVGRSRLRRLKSAWSGELGPGHTSQTPVHGTGMTLPVC